MLTHLVELFVNTVLYQRHIYPDGIFRKRRAYSTFTYVPIYPPLVTYLKRVLEVVKDLIEKDTLTVVEVVLLSNNEEIETHELKMSQVQLDMNENALEVEEHIKELLMKLESKFQALKALPENTTFRINVHTTFGSLRDVNENTSYQVGLSY